MRPHRPSSRRRNGLGNGSRTVDLQLVGKRAIVTGGSAGIGWAIARQFAREGIDVAVCSRSLERAKAAIADMAIGGGGRLIPVELELKDVESIRAAVQTGSERISGESCSPG